MKVLDLFSGIGGFSLGLERAGMETIAFCENDPFCIRVLQKHWPNIPIHKDIRELDGEQFKGQAELVTGGYPCQPFSQAGKRKGHKDDRHLWPQMFRIIAQARPAWVIAENVAGHVSMGLDRVLADLESEGYTTRPIVIPACAIDAPHRRDRVWIMAYSSGERRQQKPESPYGNEKANEQENNNKPECDGKSSGAGRIQGALANTKSGNDRESMRGETKRQGKESRESSSSKWEPWPPEPGVGRVAHGIPNRVDRLRCLGNSIVPKLAERIGYAIKKET